MAYDPRVGRTSEMYGEDPFHVSAIGVAATRALQNKTAPAANGDYFLQTSQVTRHFITDHSSSPDNRAGDYWGGLDSLEDEFLPAFKAFQVDGEAEGIMFSIAALNGTMTSTSFWTSFRALLSSTAPPYATCAMLCFVPVLIGC